ncbi:MAG: DUF3526 domain-containing protein [Bacteroidota bacterium]
MQRADRRERDCAPCGCPDKVGHVLFHVDTQESLNALAGTSSADYNSYRKQVVAFAQTWREYLLPLLYNNQDFSKENVSDLPKFEFVLQSPAIGKAILPMVIISMVLFGLGLFVVRKMNGKRHSISI